jgi:hypothetical protein
LKILHYVNLFKIWICLKGWKKTSSTSQAAGLNLMEPLLPIYAGPVRGLGKLGKTFRVVRAGARAKIWVLPVMHHTDASGDPRAGALGAAFSAIFPGEAEKGPRRRPFYFSQKIFEDKALIYEGLDKGSPLRVGDFLIPQKSPKTDQGTPALWIPERGLSEKRPDSETDFWQLQTHARTAQRQMVLFPARDRAPRVRANASF